MPTIDLTDDELAAVTGHPAPHRRRQVPPRATPRPAALRLRKARRRAKANPRPTTAEDTAANSRRKAGEALGLAAFLSPSLAAMITRAPHRLARMQGGDS